MLGNIDKKRQNLHVDVIASFSIASFFLIILTFIEYLKIVFVNMMTILMMLAKLASPGLLKMKIWYHIKL